MAHLNIKAGDTEPITYNVDLDGQDNLDNVSSAELYARKTGASSNHIDGATVTVKDSANKELEFDPVGNASGGNDAFSTGDEGTYLVYTKVTWSDGDTTRHPGDGYRAWNVDQNFES